MILKKLLEGHHILHNGTGRGRDSGVGSGGNGTGTGGVGGGPNGAGGGKASAGAGPAGIKKPPAKQTTVTVDMGTTTDPGSNLVIPIPLGSYSVFGGTLSAYGTYKRQKYSQYNTLCTVTNSANPGAGGSNGMQALSNKTYGRTPKSNGALHGGSITCTWDKTGADYDFSLEFKASMQEVLNGDPDIAVSLTATLSF